jgi:ribosomal protein S18 acetylase RimI-like enzyme
MSTAETLRLRPPRAADVAAILRIEDEAFGPDASGARQLRYLFFRAKAKTFVATRGASICGYGSILLPAAPRPARIYSLAVARPFRGQGIARRICRALIDAARKQRFERVRLEVHEDNVAGRALYEALGFERLVRLPAGYYANGHGGWRMQLKLRRGRGDDVS